MNQSERFEHILKLKAENRERKLKHDLSMAKHKAKHDAINAGVNIIITQMSITNAALWWGKT